MKTKTNLSISILAMLICAAIIINSCKPEVIKVIPTVAITAVTDITANSANSGGNITLDGGATITARGVCWSLNQNPTTIDSKTTDGIGTGVYTSSITGLIAGTTYYVKAYAINSVGTAYSSQSTFTTLALSPVLTTTTVSAVTTTSAISGGNIISDGGAAITGRGVCWSTNQNPTISASKTTDGTGTGIFISSITGLTPGTTYYLKAYATNSQGTAYGSQMTFTTTTSGGITVTDVEGNVYQTVTIGTQVWMAENLKTTKYKDNTSIPLVTDNTSWANLITPGYSWYNNEAATYKATYGALYNWYAVNTGKLCPTGWHVPTDAEWTTLTTYLGGESIAGGKLKETGTSHWASPNTGATNESGFTALPAGYRIYNGTFYLSGYDCRLWSSTEYTTYAWCRYLNYNSGNVTRGNNYETMGFSVRCLQNEGQVLPTVTTDVASAIATTSATCGGNVTNEGGASVTARGVCWNTLTNPTIALSTKTTNGSGQGAFASYLTGLNPNTVYYVRAYATNSAGTAYGTQVSFTTTSVAPVIPILTTSAVSAITQTTATCGGNVTSEGGASVTARGVCWNTLTDPTIALSTKTTNGSGPGAFASYITGLSPNTIYYVRAYATNSAGTAYGTQVSFTTSSDSQTGTVTDIESNIYNTITIGNQIWMAENLKTTKYNDGTTIPLITDGAIWYNLTTQGYCWYNNDASTYKATYGALYNWYTVNTGKLCPTGWHVPSDAQWTVLKTYLGGASIAAGKLKESGTAHWQSPNTGATNESGFTALPGGMRNLNPFEWLGSIGFWWSSTEYSDNTWAHHFTIRDDANNGAGLKALGLSIRCLRDDNNSQLPVLTTYNPTNITSTSAMSGGNITNGGTSLITARGVCWSTNQNPTTADNKTVDGTGMGIFTSSITGLTLGVTYYIRAYATNSTGTAYGNQVSITTINSLPTITTTNVTGITSTTATSGGNIANGGASLITARGVCWSTNQNPTTTDNKTADGTGSGIFTSSITGLTPGTTYYLKAYASNSQGTAYGNQLTFTTNVTVTDVEGNVYQTVTIGTQVWMAANLKTTKYRDNTSIPLVTDNNAWGNLITPGYSWYNNAAVTYKDVYGALYNWHTVNTGKLCPTGWHVPTDAEWTTLTTFLGGENIAGDKLKETGTSHWVSTNLNVTNETGFTAIPSGFRGGEGIFSNIGSGGNWWSSTESSTTNAWDRIMSSSYSGVGKYQDHKRNGFSVRCIKD